MRIGFRGLLVAVAVGFSLLAGCRGEQVPPVAPPAPPAPPAPTYTVGGTVTGLTGTVTLANNGVDSRAVAANGVFSFATPLTGGAAYSVTVSAQPADQTCTVTGASGTASTNITSVTVSCVSWRVRASIGPAGGTLSNPDGAAVVIPAGALSQATDIAIARPTSGWPTLPENVATDGDVYEYTPHGIQFAKPVLIRLPITVGLQPQVLVSSDASEPWSLEPEALLSAANQVEFERNTFSYYTMIDACVNPGSDPYPCRLPSGNASLTATPGNAVLMTSGVVPVPITYGSGQGSAGTWSVDTSIAQTLHFTMAYSAAPDCGGAHVTLRRRNAGGPSTVIADQLAPITNGRGRVTLNVPITQFDGNQVVLGYSFYCTRPGHSQSSGMDIIALNLSPNPVGGFTIGGSVTGLSGGGLELQNGSREILSVAAGSSTFAFATPLAAGANYNVSVRTQPAGNVCAVANRSGTISGNVTNLSVTCTPTGASTQGFAIVANRNSGNFSLFARHAPAGTLNLLETPTTGGGPSAAVIHPNGVHAYIANQDGGNIREFRILDPGAGSYTAEDRGTYNTPGPAALVVDPLEGRFLWAANMVSSGAVTYYRIDTETGHLHDAGSAASGTFTSAVAAHPNGNFVYSVNQLAGSITMFSVNRTSGALTSIGTLANSVSSGIAIEVTPDGRFAYALGSSTLARFSVNASSGQLASLGFTSVSGASNADDFVIHPNGRFLFVKSSNSIEASLRTYAIDTATGGLTFSSALALPAQGFAQLAIDAAGTTLYATNMTTGQVRTFSVDSATGGLTLIDTDLAGSGALGVAVTP